MLLSDDSVLYHNQRHRERSAAIWCRNVVLHHPTVEIAAIWCRYVVLQRLKPRAECCYLVPVYRITTTVTWASCDGNAALTVRLSFLTIVLPTIQISWHIAHASTVEYVHTEVSKDSGALLCRAEQSKDK